jgi:replicative DNA helicase Mcm
MGRTESVEIVTVFKEFYSNYYREEIGELAQKYPSKQRSLHIDWDDLYRFDPDLADDYLNQPDPLKEYAEEALRVYDLPVDVQLGRAHVRIQNLPERTDIGGIRARHIGQLIEITGTVDTVEETSSETAEAAFECQRCGTLNYIPQRVGEMQEPHECQGCERQGPFNINADQSEYVDCQYISIEQVAVGLGTDADRKTILVRITDDITDEVTVGDAVTITGAVRKDDSVPDSRSSVPDKFIEGVSVSLTSPYPIDISQAEEQEIRELAGDSDIYETMVQSFAPSVYGYETEKLALIFQLFSGVTKQLPDGARIRGDIHIGLIGDPGTAKTRLLRYAAKASPRSVLVSGNNTSAVGLTAAAKRTSQGQQSWTFEAGALPKADRGLACVDNLTYFGSAERESLHDALEDQVINLSKGSRTTSIQARASLLAAAAPKYGRFDQYESIGEQLDLDPGILSQLDLMFVFVDDPDRKEDEELAEHILEANYVGEIQSRREETEGQPAEKINEETTDITPPIEPALLRKYIIYAQQNIYPSLTDDAQERLKEFYIDLRTKEPDDDDDDRPVPVTARKLEAMVRLAEASARVRLSETVETADVDRSIDLIKTSLTEIGVDTDHQQYNASVVETGKEHEDGAENLKNLISEIALEYDDGAPVDVVLNRVSEIGMSQSKAERDIKKLKHKGEVYEPNIDYLRVS